MARIKTYPDGVLENGDKILFTDVSDNDATKNAEFSDVVNSCVQATTKARMYVYAEAGVPYTTETVAGEWIALTTATEALYTVGDLSVSTIGIIEYTGEDPIVLAFNGVIDVAGVDNSSLTTFAFALNNEPVLQSAQTLDLPDNGTNALVPGVGMLELSNGDTLRLYVKTDNDDTITTSNVNIILFEV